MGQAYMLDKQYAQAAACFGYSYRHTPLCRWLRCKTIHAQIQLCAATGNKKKLKDKQAELLRCCQESRYDWLLDNTIS